MRPRNQRIRDVLALCVLALLLGNESCEEESGTPVADAGADITIELGQPAQLDGSASTDPDAGSLVFHWNLESKPVTSAMANSSFSKNTSADAAQTSFVPDVPGTYGVSLYVANEGEQSSDLDYVVVIAGSTNTLPVADAGVDVEAGVDEVAYLDGSASSDPEGAALQYEWSFDLVPADSTLTESDLFNQGSPEAAVVPDVVGQFVLLDAARIANCSGRPLGVFADGVFEIVSHLSRSQRGRELRPPIGITTRCGGKLTKTTEEIEELCYI